MPTYDYVCTECEHAFEHFQTMTSDLLTECPKCEGKLKRLFGAGAALIFKGSGFYCTDYKGKGKGKKLDEGKLDAKVEATKAAAKEVKESSSPSSSGGGESGGGTKGDSGGTSGA